MKKRIIVLTLLVSFALILTFFNLHNKPSISAEMDSRKTLSTDTLKPAEDIPTIFSQADFIKTFNSVEELSEVSNIIIQGQVLSTEYFTFNQNVFTKSKVKVQKAYKGDIIKGEEVTFIEIGGITTFGEIQKMRPDKLVVKPEDMNNPIKMTLNGSETMKANEKVVLFGALPSENKMLKENYYMTVGAHQGKLQILKDKVKRFVPNGEEKTFSTFESTLEEIDQKLLNIAKSK